MHQRAAPRRASRRPHPGAFALLACVALLGCGGGHGSAPRATTTATATATTTAIAGPPEPLDTCPEAGDGWVALPVPGVAAASLGKGPPVVLLNDSGNMPCDWIPLARRLARRGLAVTVYAYTFTDALHEPDSAAEALAVARAAGGATRPFALVGASLGGRLVFRIAARSPRHLAAVVSLSGERTVLNYPDILGLVRRTRVPVLYAAADDDPLTEGDKQPRQIAAALPHRPRLLLSPGSAHGTDLLAEPRIVTALTRFVVRHLAHR